MRKLAGVPAFVAFVPEARLRAGSASSTRHDAGLTLCAPIGSAGAEAKVDALSLGVGEELGEAFLAHGRSRTSTAPWISLCRKARDVEAQDWPHQAKFIPATIPPATASGSASAKAISAFLPPSSSSSGLTRSAAVRALAAGPAGARWRGCLCAFYLAPGIWISSFSWASVSRSVVYLNLTAFSTSSPVPLNSSGSIIALAKKSVRTSLALASEVLAKSA